VRNIAAEHSSRTVTRLEKIATVAETAHAAVESTAAYRRPRGGRYYDGCFAQVTAIRVSRAQRSASSAFTRVFDALWRCPPLSRGQGCRLVPDARSAIRDPGPL